MKLYSNKVFLFNEGSEDFVAKQGFSTAPDWVAKTDLFAAAVKEGSLKVVEGSTFTEAEKKMAAEEKAAYEAKIAELEAALAEKSKVADVVLPVDLTPVDTAATDTVAAEITEEKAPAPKPKK